MLMCLCYGISCHEIKKIVQSGIATTEGVQQECNAGMGCGCCVEALKRMVESEVDKLNTHSITSSHVAVALSNSRSRCP